MIASACALLLCASVPGLLVICNGPSCRDAIEFVHAGDCACDCQPAVEQSTPSPASDPLLVVRQGDCGCVDVAMEMPTGPLPERVVLPTCPAHCDGLSIEVPAAVPSPGKVMRPPPTGPPRVDRRTVLRASTQLLI